jgi:GntR family transcriptional regulator
MGGSVTLMTATRIARYVQLAEDIRAQIDSGQLAPGAPIPSEGQLAAEYGLSRTSVRSALETLRQAGLVRTVKGAGTHVREQHQRMVRRVPERYQWEKDRVHLPEYERRAAGSAEYDTGLPTERFIFLATYDDLPAPPDLAQVFGVDEGTTLLRRVYRTHDRLASAYPMGVGCSYLLRGMVEGNPDLLDPAREPWPGGTQHQLSTVGIELDRIIDELTTRPPSREEAEALGIDSKGTSVFVLRKISIDTEERVVEVNDAVMPGDTTQLVYVAKLQRWTP